MINNLVEGWLFDAYPLKDKMIIWMKLAHDKDKTIRLEDKWTHSIYVASNDKSDLKSLVDKINGHDSDFASLIKDYELIPRYERITDSIRTEVLKLRLLDSTRALDLARKIETHHGNNNRRRSNKVRSNDPRLNFQQFPPMKRASIVLLIPS